MNETLKAAGHIGAELGAAMAENARLKSLMRQALPCLAMSTNSHAGSYMRQFEAALSQQAEPAPAGWVPCSPELLDSGVCCATAPRIPGAPGSGISHYHPAPAQDEREALETARRIIVEVRRSCTDTDFLVPVIARMLTRPAQTEQQPEQSGLVGQVCGGDGTHNTVNVAVVGPVPWGDLRIGTPVRLIPAPATPSPAMDAKEE